MTQEQLEHEYATLYNYNQWICQKTLKFIQAKRKAFTSKDKRDFAIMRNIEKELLGLLQPKKDNQTEIDWLGK
jgi:hypothetical protein